MTRSVHFSVPDRHPPRSFKMSDKRRWFKLNLKLIKCLMFCFNFIFWLSGLILLTIGLALRLNFAEYFTFATDKFSHGENLLMATGTIVLLVGLVGCYGALKENYFIVSTFAILLSLVCVLELVAGTVAYTHRRTIHRVAQNAFEDAVKQYKENNVSRSLVDWAQQKLECCGSNGVKDYNFRHDSYLVSPCGERNGGVPTCHVAAKCRGVLYGGGCREKFVEFVKEKLCVVGGVGVGMAFVQLVGIVLASCLTRAIKWEYEIM